MHIIHIIYIIHITYNNKYMRDGINLEGQDRHKRKQESKRHRRHNHSRPHILLPSLHLPYIICIYNICIVYHISYICVTHRIYINILLPTAHNPAFFASVIYITYRVHYTLYISYYIHIYITYRVHYKSYTSYF